MIIALIAIVLAFAHKLLKGLYFSDSIQTSIGDVSLNTFIVISIFSILLMISRLFFKIKIIDTLRRFFNNLLKLRYESKVLIHNIMDIALIILFIHVLMSSSVDYNLPLKIVLIIYFIVPLSLYFNHKIIKVYFNKDKKFIVSDTINEAENIVTVKFTPIIGKVFNYLPGKFLYLKIYNQDIPGDEHPFTISSSPLENNDLAVTIKQIGDFTKSLSKVNIGDRAYIDGSFDSFHILISLVIKKFALLLEELELHLF